MSLTLAASYVLHVTAGLLWAGMTVYVAAAVLPAARRGALGERAFGRQVDALLQTTRVTGVVLPATGLYQVWRLYPPARLLGTTEGALVLSMVALWGLLNGAIEAGAFRMRRTAGPFSLRRYFFERFPRTFEDAPTARVAAVGWRYIAAAAVFAVLLVVDAGLLAAAVR